MPSTSMLAALVLPFLLSARAQVTATFANGVTNPDVPAFAEVGSTVNQTSNSRLLSLNGVDDFCIYGPPEAGPDSLIGNVEPIVVAYCTKPRNGARLIPDGTIKSAHFVRTPLYVQIYGLWDGTKVNIPAGDSGGELDPHGAENLGNPIGGNVTSDVPTGTAVFYEEWMSFVSADQYCLRICTAQTADVTTALQCEHELDVLGCAFVMAIDDLYTAADTFTECDGEAAAPPGLYKQANGSTSTFRQRYTGTYTDGAQQTQYFTVGQEVTPSAPAFYPSKSNCLTYPSISNGIDTANYAVTASVSTLSGGQTNAIATTAASTGSGASSATSGASSARSTGSASTASRTGTVTGSNTAAAASSSTTSGGMIASGGASDAMLLALGMAAVGVVAGAVGILA